MVRRLRHSKVRPDGSAAIEQLCLLSCIAVALVVAMGPLGDAFGRSIGHRAAGKQETSQFSSNAAPQTGSSTEAAMGTLARHALVPLAREVSDWTRLAFAEAVHIDADQLPASLRFVDELDPLTTDARQSTEWAATLRAIESSRLDRRANALRQMKGGEYAKLDVSEIDETLRSGARVDLPIIEGASAVGDADGRTLLEAVAGPDRMIAHPLEGALRGDVVETVPAWMASSERTFHVPVGARVAQSKTDMSHHTSSGFYRPMNQTTVEHALLTNGVFEHFFKLYGTRRPMVDFAPEPAALLSTNEDFGALLRLSGDGGRLYSPRVFSWVDPDLDYGGQTLLTAYVNQLQGSELQKLRVAYQSTAEAALISGMTVAVDMGGYAGTHQQNLGLLLGIDGFPLARGEVADLNDTRVLSRVAMRDFDPTLREELSNALAAYKKQPYERPDGRVAHRNGRGEEIIGWQPMVPFSRWVANDVMAVLLGELDQAAPGHGRWLREKTTNAFFNALERRRPIVEAHHSGKAGAANDAFLDLLNKRTKSRYWKSLSTQIFRHLEQ